MSELGSSAAVGIESVEWLDAGGGQLTVRVTGRWRRRRGWVESRGPTMLVIEAGGRRHRFPATPEPPSLSGAAPGTWRLSFSVPAEFADGLGGHVWLALGTVTVPLPVPDSAAAAAADVPAAQEPPAAAAAPAGSPTEPAEPAATGSPAEEQVPDEAPRALEPGRDPGRLEIERAWRRADAAERAAGELGERISALERALQHERAAGVRQMLVPEPVDPGGAEQQRLRAEGALRAAHRGTVARVPTEPISPPAAPAPGARPGPTATPAPVAGGLPGDRETISALRRELHTRVAAEAALHARTVQAETRLAARVLLEQRTTAAMGELRTELERLHDALERERERRRGAERDAARLRVQLGGQRERSRDAHQAIEELRSAIESLRPSAPSRPAAPRPTASLQSPHGAAPEPARVVTPDRLTDALTRLRETTEPREPEGEMAGDPLVPAASVAITPAVSGAPAAPRFDPLPVAVSAPTVEEPFRRLARRDPERAGRLVTGLLGAQRTAWPHAVAYDLVLGPGYGTVQVTSGERGVSVERGAATRPREQVAFQVLGAPGPLARLLTAGRLRRLLRVGVARVRGRREGLGALRALLALPLDLGALGAAGVSLDGETLFTLLVAMIEPAWTRGERFTVSHTDERGHAVYLQIRDGEPPLASLEPPAGRIATALAGPVDQLWRMFADGGSAAADGAGGVLATGDEGPLTLVRTWANRAQSGHGAH